MGKVNDAMELSAWTTGAGIAIGTNIDLGGVLMGSAATTVTLLSGTTIILSLSGGSVVFAENIGAVGAINGTSSGGSFGVIFRKRNS